MGEDYKAEIGDRLFGSEALWCARQPALPPPRPSPFSRPRGDGAGVPLTQPRVRSDISRGIGDVDSAMDPFGKRL